MNRCTLALVAAAGVMTGACTPNIDLKQSLKVTDVSSGWFDAGVVEGKNKLVPSVTFRLEKAVPDIPALALNLVFRAEGDTEHYDEVYIQKVDFTDGNKTAPTTVRSKFGYTGEPPQSRMEMLKNPHFVDMDVQVFAKYGSGQWVELHRLKIPRLLLTQ
ncbi:MAG: hypothetical protein A3H96_17215 [Acidobacteria bacterium RIFCSPLOWO2_02_FULL_67_36]|nr:MAG: hypothetical protein A3H96_17215 [Acidobacteria bacterium RIFCSPLOWO2_02_FULL_67_36]OFW25755.1 MAG: hypothetical protein A3G21_25100 [Acidobacteria bacterium RIFCSPLOWO2_12_FULL_66_21]